MSCVCIQSWSWNGFRVACMSCENQCCHKTPLHTKTSNLLPFWPLFNNQSVWSFICMSTEALILAQSLLPRPACLSSINGEFFSLSLSGCEWMWIGAAPWLLCHCHVGCRWSRALIPPDKHSWPNNGCVCLASNKHLRQVHCGGPPRWPLTPPVSRLSLPH